MKFGKFIQKRQLEIPEYAARFVDYKALKKLIKKLSATPVIQAQIPGVSHAGQTDSQASLQANKATFFFRLERELEKVNTFYVQKEDELKLRLKTLLERKRALEQRQRSASKLTSVYRTLDEGFRLFNSDLDKLQQFVEINQTAFSKILKKWDKTSKSRTKELYLSRAVEVQPCFNRDVISDLSDKATTSLLDLADWAEGNNVVVRVVNTDPAAPQLDVPVEDGDADNQIQNELLAHHTAVVLDWITNISTESDGAQRISRLVLSTVNQAALDVQTAILGTGLVDVNYADDINERTCLHELAISGRLDTLELMLQYGADVRGTDGYGRTPLHYACMNGKVNVIPPLHEADVRQSSLGMTNGLGQSTSATPAGIIDLVDLDNFTPLVHGIVNSHYEVVETLLSLHARVDPLTENDHIPLNLACQYGSALVVELLLRYRPQILPDAEGLYPQHLVPRSGTSPKILLLLRDYGADLNQPDKLYQWTPLFHAASEGHLLCLQALLECGANANVCDEKGLPAMYYAAWEGRLDCLKLLEGATNRALARTSPAVAAVQPPLAAPPSQPISARGEPESIPDLELPPPIIPLRRYGHNFLDTTKTYVVISFDTVASNAIVFYGDNKYPAARLTISSRSSDLIPRNIALPIQDESKHIAFQIQDLDSFFIDFDIYPTFGSKVIARAAASSTVFSSRSSSSGSWHLELFDPRLKNIGRMSFRYQVVTPFRGVPVEVTQFATYWKATSQISSQTNPLITGSSLQGDYLRLFVQTTRDGVPVLYPLWAIPSSLARFGLNNDLISRVTYKQLKAIIADLGHPSTAELIQQLASSNTQDPLAIAKKLAGSLAALQDVLALLPAQVHLDVHIIYPTRKQEEELRLGPTSNMNAVVDAVLGVVFDHTRQLRQIEGTKPRSMVFSSYNADVCTALNWKQPNYPVLLCNDLGSSPTVFSLSTAIHSQGRATLSVKEAVRVAQANNFMGLIVSSRLLSLVPALTHSIKTAGLVLITDVADSTKENRPAAPVSSFHGIPEDVDGMLEGNGVLRFKESIDV